MTRRWHPGSLRIRTATALVACAVLLVAVRLLTGILVLDDDPTAYLVLKRHPSLATIVRAGTGPLRHDYVLLDDDENALVYETPYLFVARHAPLLGGACLLVGVAILAWPRRP